MIKKGFISGVGINYAGTLPKVNKSENQLQSIFEAFGMEVLSQDTGN